MHHSSGPARPRPGAFRFARRKLPPLRRALKSLPDLVQLIESGGHPAIAAKVLDSFHVIALELFRACVRIRQHPRFVPDQLRTYYDRNQ